MNGVTFAVRAKLARSSVSAAFVIFGVLFDHYVCIIDG